MSCHFKRASLLLLLSTIANVSVYGDALTGLPACTAAGQLNCVASTSGGETAIVYEAANTIEVYGDLNGGQTVT